MVIAVVLTYFLVLLGVSRLVARGGENSNSSFFRAGRQSPWYMVAFGMVGASISGVTFVSVPGMVMHSGMTYLQTCMGFIVGYFVVAFVLLPVYYRLNLTSIYTVLKGTSDEAYKTGAMFFIVSKLLGSAAKFFVPCFIVSQAVGVNFYLTTIGLFALIWLYTRRGGIKTLVWTDTLQTLCMLTALVLIIYYVYGALFDFQFSIINLKECLAAIAQSDYSKVFEFEDWGSANNFFKCFVAGIFIVIVMTGLDQDMMQKNLTCKTLRDAQKDMCTYGFAFLPVNALFLGLGVMLTMLCAKEGVALPDKPDELLSMFALNGTLGYTVLILFTLGIIATSFSTVDSAITALTTSFCVDIMGRENDVAMRRKVHIGMTVAMIALTAMFNLVSSHSLIDTIYTLVSYTYGPLLGLFMYSLIDSPSRPLLKRGEQNEFVRGGGEFVVCILSPLICFGLDTLVPRLTGYHFGYELLLINGLITYAGLRMLKIENRRLKIEKFNMDFR